MTQRPLSGFNSGGGRGTPANAFTFGAPTAQPTSSTRNPPLSNAAPTPASQYLSARAGQANLFAFGQNAALPSPGELTLASISVSSNSPSRLKASRQLHRHPYRLPRAHCRRMVHRSPIQRRTSTRQSFQRWEGHRSREGGHRRLSRQGCSQITATQVKRVPTCRRPLLSVRYRQRPLDRRETSTPNQTSLHLRRDRTMDRPILSTACSTAAVRRGSSKRISRNSRALQRHWRIGKDCWGAWDRRQRTVRGMVPDR